MTTVPSLRRLALLVALLPQLLVLGLGPGLVVCVVPGGHFKVEVGASECCADANSAATAPDADVTVSSDEPDCGSCSDYRIGLEARLFRSSGVNRAELPSDSTAALPLEIPTLRVAQDPTHSVGLPLDRGHVPLHLIHLRSVVLRC